MIEFAVSFYENYTIFFYVLIVIIVILEGPITVVTLSLLNDNFGMGYFAILLLAFVGDFVGDVLHFLLGRFGKNFICKYKKMKKIEPIIKKIESYSFFDKLIVIKYTPPITSIGLIYMGTTKMETWDFMKKVAIICFLSSLTVSFIAYNIGNLFPKENISSVFIGIGLAIITIYFVFKYLSKYILKQVNKKNDT